MPTVAVNALGLTPREAAIDALVRFVTGLDIPSHELLLSSLTTDATMELTGFAAAGMPPDRTVGPSGAEITKLLMDAVGKRLDTTHSATNVRCFIKDNGDGTEKAEITATILAQHFRGGEGPGHEFRDFWANGNAYECEAVPVVGEWRMRKVVIRPVWSLGDRDVMKG